MDEFDAEDYLTALESRSLLFRLETQNQEAQDQPLRFRFHDLVRDFASRKIKSQETTRPRITACWTHWDFLEQELNEAGAFELSGQYQRLGRQPEDPRNFIAWRAFIRGQAHVLAEHPGLFFQQAYNEPKDSPVSLQTSNREPTIFPWDYWLEWINRPKEFVPPCLRNATSWT